MGPSAISLWIAFAILVQDGTAPKDVGSDPTQTYPWEIVPQDALWGHLSEGNFREPVGVFYERTAKELYVADSKNARIGIFNVEGTPLFSFGGASVLLEPHAVLAVSDGTIFVLDGSTTELRRFNYRGEAEPSLTFRVRAEGDEPARALELCAVARDATGRWYVGDRSTNRVFAFDSDREPLFEFPPPIGKEHFESLSDVAVSTDGLVAVCDQRGVPTIHVYDSRGKLLHAFGDHDIGLNNFTAAIAIEFDEHGFLYAVDLLRHDVKVFTPAGKMVARFGGWFSPETRGRAPGELLYPADIAIAPDGPIWVAERFGQRVQLFARKPRETRVPGAKPAPDRK